MTAPSTKSPSNLARNHSPNSAAFEIARHTRERGARSRIFFSIRFSSIILICNLLVANLAREWGETQPSGCAKNRVNSTMRFAVLFLAPFLHAQSKVDGQV